MAQYLSVLSRSCYLTDDQELIGMTLHAIISNCQAYDRKSSLLKGQLVSRNKTASQEFDHSSPQLAAVLRKIFTSIIALFPWFYS